MSCKVSIEKYFLTRYLSKMGFLNDKLKKVFLGAYSLLAYQTLKNWNAVGFTGLTYSGDSVIYAIAL